MTNDAATTGNSARILIEVTPTRIADGTGEQSTRVPAAERSSVAGLIEKASDNAIDAAFGVIQGMAQRTAQVVAEMQQLNGQPMPASLDVEFGVSFTGDLQAYIAKAGATATFTVKLSWSLKAAE